MQRSISIYQISKLRHAEKMMKMRDQYPDLHFTARWPITAGLGSEAQRPVYQWMREAEGEICNSDCVYVYVEAGEILKTGLLQIGIAYRQRIPIFVIGEHISYAEWQFDEYSVTRCRDEKYAIQAIKTRFRGEQRMIGRQIGPKQSL